MQLTLFLIWGSIWQEFLLLYHQKQIQILEIISHWDPGAQRQKAPDVTASWTADEHISLEQEIHSWWKSWPVFTIIAIKSNIYILPDLPHSCAELVRITYERVMKISQLRVWLKLWYWNEWEILLYLAVKKSKYFIKSFYIKLYMQNYKDTRITQNACRLDEAECLFIYLSIFCIRSCHDFFSSKKKSEQ